MNNRKLIYIREEEKKFIEKQAKKMKMTFSAYIIFKLYTEPNLKK